VRAMRSVFRREERGPTERGSLEEPLLLLFFLMRACRSRSKKRSTLVEQRSGGKMTDLFQMPIIDQETYEGRPISRREGTGIAFVSLRVCSFFFFFPPRFLFQHLFAICVGIVDRPPRIIVPACGFLRAGSQRDGKRSRFFAVSRGN